VGGSAAATAFSVVVCSTRKPCERSWLIMRFAASASLNAATCTQYGPFDEAPLVVATADGILVAATRDRSGVISRLFVATVAGLAAATFRAGCAVAGVASGVLAGPTGGGMAG